MVRVFVCQSIKKYTSHFNNPFTKEQKKENSCKNCHFKVITDEGVSFEWSHHTISSTVWNVSGKVL